MDNCEACKLVLTNAHALCTLHFQVCRMTYCVVFTSSLLPVFLHVISGQYELVPEQGESITKHWWSFSIVTGYDRALRCELGGRARFDTRDYVLLETPPARSTFHTLNTQVCFHRFWPFVSYIVSLSQIVVEKSESVANLFFEVGKVLHYSNRLQTFFTSVCRAWKLWCFMTFILFHAICTCDPFR